MQQRREAKKLLFLFQLFPSVKRIQTLTSLYRHSHLITESQLLPRAKKHPQVLSSSYAHTCPQKLIKRCVRITRRVSRNRETLWCAAFLGQELAPPCLLHSPPSLLFCLSSGIDRKKPTDWLKVEPICLTDRGRQLCVPEWACELCYKIHSLIALQSALRWGFWINTSTLVWRCEMRLVPRSWVHLNFLSAFEMRS